MLHAREASHEVLLSYHFENLYGKFNSVSITTCFNALFIAALIWWKGSTKTGKVSSVATGTFQWRI